MIVAATATAPAPRLMRCDSGGRGKSRYAHCTARKSIGSSPRGRGTHLAVRGGRFIPARAGNTLVSAVDDQLYRLHPRAGGEHPRAAAAVSHGFDNAILSSLFDAVTDKRINGSAGHSRAYYDADPSAARQAEAFANIMSIVGSGEIGRQLLERFTPGVYGVFRERMETP